MKRVSPKTIIVGLLIALLTVFFFATSSTLSILGDTNTHYHDLNGVRVAVNADWQDTDYSDGECIVRVSDASTSSQVGATIATSGNDPDNRCPPKVFTTSFALPDIDLTDVERIVIQRDIDYNVIVENRKLVLQSTVLEKSQTLPAPTTGIGGVTGEYDETIIVTQANDVLTIDSAEGRTVIDAQSSSPVLFTTEFRMGGSSGDPNIVNGHVFIKDITIEYLPGQDPTSPTLGIWQKIVVWINELFSTIKGWFV